MTSREYSGATVYHSNSSNIHHDAIHDLRTKSNESTKSVLFNTL